MQTVEEIAAKLGKSAKRALLRIGTNWTPEGAPGPAERDVYSLWWGRSNFGLVERPKLIAMGEGGFNGWSWKLTPLGRRVKAIIEKEADHG